MVCDLLLCGILTILSCFPCARCGTLQQAKDLYEILFHNYSTDIRPIWNQDDAVFVSVGLSLVNLNDFDEVKGVISISVFVTLTWTDVGLTWDANLYNTSSLTVSEQKVWLPRLFLMNTADHIKAISNRNFKVKTTASGLVLWNPVALLKAACSPDVKKFPYDEQTCSIILTPLGYLVSEVTLLSSSDVINLENFQENSEWKVDTTSALIRLRDGSRSAAMFSFRLKRRPLYMIINVVIPIILLVIVTPLVFLLPIGCGERTSYTITVLLSFSVYMTVVSDKMPASSLPVSNLSYLLLICLLISMLVVAINVLQTRMYEKSNEYPPPRYIATLVICLQKLAISKRQPRDKRRFHENVIHPEITEINSESKDDNEDVSSKGQRKEDFVTWKMVAATLDKVYFVVFCLGGTLVSAFFMLAIGHMM